MSTSRSEGIPLSKFEKMFDYLEASSFRGKPIHIGKVGTGKIKEMYEDMNIHQEQSRWFGQVFYAERTTRPKNELGWSLEKNRAFMAGAIAANREVILTSTIINLESSARNNGTTPKEILWLLDNKYTYILKPSNPDEIIFSPPKTKTLENRMMPYDHLMIEDINRIIQFVADAKQMQTDLKNSIKPQQIYKQPSPPDSKSTNNDALSSSNSPNNSLMASAVVPSLESQSPPEAKSLNLDANTKSNLNSSSLSVANKQGRYIPPFRQRVVGAGNNALSSSNFPNNSLIASAVVPSLESQSPPEAKSINQNANPSFKQNSSISSMDNTLNMGSSPNINSAQGPDKPKDTPKSTTSNLNKYVPPNRRNNPNEGRLTRITISSKVSPPIDPIATPKYQNKMKKS